MAAAQTRQSNVCFCKRRPAGGTSKSPPSPKPTIDDGAFGLDVDNRQRMVMTLLCRFLS